MNDFRKIRTIPGNLPLAPSSTVIWHAQEREWLAKELRAAKGKKIVVITHHLPSSLSLPQDLRNTRLSTAYASALDELVADSGAALWVHGHTHDACDYRLGETRVFCNPRGYPHEVPIVTGFQFDLTVEI